MNIIKQQFDKMVQSGRIPVMEYPVLIDGKKEWLTVELSANDKGINFSFDNFDLPASFDGSIVVYSDTHYLIPYDSFDSGENDSDDLDYYLIGISDNITEGFICTNQIWFDEE
jgi:hypothetical protein